MVRQYNGVATRACETCGALVTRKASAFKAHTYCSRVCYSSSTMRSEATRVINRQRNPDSRVVLACFGCGTEFERYRSQINSRSFCSRECQRKHAVDRSARQITGTGYVKVFVGRGAAGANQSGHILEHRLVMQEHLGRPLLEAENVHHVNGVRTDNRLSNLELWSHSQPRGQRVKDKLAWAREFLAQYEDSIVDQ